MKRVLFSLLLSAAALAPALVRAQEKPSLNTAPPAPVPPVVTPVPTPAPTPDGAIITAPADTVRGSYRPPAGYDRSTQGGLPAPSSDSPSGFELPGREQARKAAQQHAEMYSKLFIYTGAGLGYSSFNGYGQFNVSVSPALGYRLSDRIAVGPGISYSYSNYSFGQGYKSVGTSNFGVKVFGQATVYKQFFIHAEYEVTNAQLLEVDNNGYLTGRTVQQRVETPLAGVGYRSQFSPRVAADIVVLYNFKDDFNSLYPNPVIRFNFLFNIGH